MRFAQCLQGSRNTGETAPFRGLTVVGYNSTKLREGSLGVAPQFEGIASADGSYDLQQIKCNDAANQKVSFCVLDAVGIDGESFTWTTEYDPYWTFDPEKYESCWIDGSGTKVEGFTVTPGMGLWVAGTQDPVNPDEPNPETDQIITFPAPELD